MGETIGSCIRHQVIIEDNGQDSRPYGAWTWDGVVTILMQLPYNSIYTQGERERERYAYIHRYIHTHTYISARMNE